MLLRFRLVATAAGVRSPSPPPSLRQARTQERGQTRPARGAPPSPRAPLEAVGDTGWTLLLVDRHGEEPQRGTRGCGPTTVRPPKGQNWPATTEAKDAASTPRSGWRRAERERELDANLAVCVRFLRKEKKTTKKTSSLQYL